MSITYPPEMLPVADEAAEVVIVCACGRHWVPEDGKCPNCGQAIEN